MSHLAAVTATIADRRLRDGLFADGLFADPAWDILLDLYSSELRGRSVSVSSLCIAANVPGTTALRWIASMVDDGLLERWDDPTDKRRALIGLSKDASAAMRRYFDRCHAVGGALDPMELTSIERFRAIVNRFAGELAALP